ncbi:MAG TPA: DUF5665 domain-containing protein [bacterium]|nr:DUF5665 domain-containing protein [bacterium]
MQQKPKLPEITPEDIHTIKTFAGYLEQIKFGQYLENQTNLGKVIWFNLLAGIVRGFGYVIGATLLIAIFSIIISWLGGLPWIGEIVAKIVEKVQEYQAQNPM